MPDEKSAGLIGDPLVSHNFFLELDGEVVGYLSGVSGLDVEVEVVTTTQAGKGGQRETVKSLGGQNKAPDLTLTRMAPTDATADKLWEWFNSIRDKGVKDLRKNGSVVIYDSTNTEVSRFNFFDAWPSKINTDGLSVDSNDPLKETITLVCGRLERIK